MRYVLLALAGTIQALALSNSPLADYVTYLPTGPYTAVDSSGDLYFAGTSASSCALRPELPTVNNLYGSITKLSAGADKAIWTACLSGAVGGLALDATDAIYVVN